MQEYLEIGQIVNTHGLKGYLKVTPFTDDINRFSNLKTVYIEYKKELIKHEIEDVRYVKNMVNVKLINIDDINDAEKYKGCYIKIDRKDAKKLKENTYFIADLIGIEVKNMDNKKIGILEDVIKTGSNDVYIVKTDNGKQILLPAIKKVIKSVDIEKRIIIADESSGVSN